MTLLERDPHAPASWPGEMPVTSRYTFGLAGERFFRAIKDEAKLYGTYCAHCDHTYLPATAFCERCLNELTEWVEVSPRGEIHSFTVLFEDYSGAPLESPELIAFVRLADGGLVHRLGEVDADEVFIGMPVEAVFKPAADRTGSIEDISHFKPVD